MKKLIISIFIILLGAALGYKYFMDDETTTPSIIKENNISKEEAKVTIVTFGERIEDDRAYFYQWENQDKSIQKKLVEQEMIFLFSVEEFQKEKNQDLIESLVKNHKTVLFYGYKINIKESLGENNIIPYYSILSNKDIHSYLYGYGFSKPSNKMIPVTVMGNFEEYEMSKNIVSYLIKHFNNNK